MCLIILHTCLFSWGYVLVFTDHIKFLLTSLSICGSCDALLDTRRIPENSRGDLLKDPDVQ